MSTQASAAPAYGFGEEIANSVTHGIGALLSLVGLTLLIVFASLWGDAWRIVSFTVYGVTLLILYLASTFYHSFSNPSVKRVFQVFDHAAIYVLIAGTYTPYTLVTMRGVWGWTLFGMIWGLASAGIILKVIFRNRYDFIFTGLYVAMGWLVVVALKPLLSSLSTGGAALLVLGGLSYTGGVAFYVQRRQYSHAVWHLFVLGGSVFHYFSILLHVLPMDTLSDTDTPLAHAPMGVKL